MGFDCMLDGPMGSSCAGVIAPDNRREIGRRDLPVDLHTHPLLLDGACYRKLDISSSSPDCDHNLYVGPCPLYSYRDSMQSSGLESKHLGQGTISWYSCKVCLLALGITCLGPSPGIRSWIGCMRRLVIDLSLTWSSSAPAVEMRPFQNDNYFTGGALKTTKWDSIARCLVLFAAPARGWAAFASGITHKNTPMRHFMVPERFWPDKNRYWHGDRSVVFCVVADSAFALEILNIMFDLFIRDSDHIAIAFVYMAVGL